jgi:hypothetical protein
MTDLVLCASFSMYSCNVFGCDSSICDLLNEKCLVIIRLIQRLGVARSCCTVYFAKYVRV